MIIYGKVQQLQKKNFMKVSCFKLGLDSVGVSKMDHAIFEPLFPFFIDEAQ